MPTRQGLVDSTWAAFLFLAISSFAGAIWAQRSALAPWIQGVLFILGFVFAGILLYVAFVSMKERFREKRSRRTADPHFEPAATALAAEQAPIAHPESIERLRELMLPCEKAIQFAYEFFIAGVPGEGRSNRSAATVLIRELLERYSAPEMARALEATNDALRKQGAWTEDDLENALGAIDNLFVQYIYFSSWLQRAGPLLAGGEAEFLSDPTYKTLLTRHGKLLDSIRLASARLDFRFASRRLGDLESLYPPPSNLPTVVPPSLVVRHRMDSLHSSRPTGSTRDETYHWIRVGLLQREFLLLEVSNETSKEIPSLVARRKTKEGVWIRDAIWSSSTGERFILGGSHSAPLAAGDSRLLVVAQCFKEGAMWARVAEPLLDLPMIVSNEDGTPKSYYTSSGDLSLGAEVEIDVQLVADGISQTYGLRLSFVGSEPKVELEPKGS